MSITVLLGLGCIGAILTTTGLAGLHFENRNRLEQVEEQLRKLEESNKALKRQVHKLKTGAAKPSDKVTIVYEPDNSKAPGYKNF